MRGRLNRWLGGYAMIAMNGIKVVMHAIMESVDNLVFKGTADMILIGIVVAIGADGIVLEGVLFGRIFMRKFRIRRELKSFGLTQADIGFAVRLFRLLASRGFGKKTGQTPLEAALIAAKTRLASRNSSGACGTLLQSAMGSKGLRSRDDSDRGRKGSQHQKDALDLIELLWV